MDDQSYQPAGSGTPVGQRMTVETKSNGEMLPPGLRTPEEREATYAQLMRESLTSGRKPVDFDPLPKGTTDIVYLRNNRFNGVHISELELFIPGRMNPDHTAGPFYLISREQLDRTLPLKMLLLTPIKALRDQDPDNPEDKKTILEEITEEQYFQEYAEWQEKAARVREKQAERAIALRGDEEDTGDLKLNRQILVSQGISAQ